MKTKYGWTIKTTWFWIPVDKGSNLKHRPHDWKKQTRKATEADPGCCVSKKVAKVPSIQRAQWASKLHLGSLTQDLLDPTCTLRTRCYPHVVYSPSERGGERELREGTDSEPTAETVTAKGSFTLSPRALKSPVSTTLHPASNWIFLQDCFFLKVQVLDLKKFDLKINKRKRSIS